MRRSSSTHHLCLVVQLATFQTAIFGLKSGTPWLSILRMRWRKIWRKVSLTIRIAKSMILMRRIRAPARRRDPLAIRFSQAALPPPHKTHLLARAFLSALALIRATLLHQEPYPREDPFRLAVRPPSRAMRVTSRSKWALELCVISHLPKFIRPNNEAKTACLPPARPHLNGTRTKAPHPISKEKMAELSAPVETKYKSHARILHKSHVLLPKAFCLSSSVSMDMGVEKCYLGDFSASYLLDPSARIGKAENFRVYVRSFRSSDLSARF
jgi:hypothetical protein